MGLLVLMVAGQSVATTYATWIMVWYGHDQAWWSATNPDASKNLVNGQWKTLDWADNSQFDAYLEGIRKAGVTVVIADLTNGWNWLDTRCQFIQSLCAKKNMKFCIAENSGGNVAGFESHSKDIWDKFAGPDAPNHETYFHYRGKPLIVCYAVRDWYRSYINSKSPFRSRFSLVWASGEDSSINKWGWQLEPWVGSVPSADSMYVTSAVRWNPADGAMWRKSLAWLDYNFALAKKSNPEYVIIGSYDDPTERNAWAVSDTAKCELGRQMRDSTGALSSSAYYDRVKQWISGKPTMVPGGLLRDGAYRIVSRSSGKYLGISNAGKSGQGVPGAVLVGSTLGKAPLGLFWLYHLGGNHYRIIAVAGGLALEAKDGGVVQNWDSTDSKQRWTLARASDGYFWLTNDGTGKALALDANATDDTPTALRAPSGDQIQQWRFQEYITLPTARLPVDKRASGR